MNTNMLMAMPVWVFAGVALCFSLWSANRLNANYKMMLWNMQVAVVFGIVATLITIGPSK